MRNIFKPAAQTASSRERRSVRGVAAVVASVALAAGLVAYPVDAQETAAVSAASTERCATDVETRTLTVVGNPQQYAGNSYTRLTVSGLKTDEMVRKFSVSLSSGKFTTTRLDFAGPLQDTRSGKLTTYEDSKFPNYTELSTTRTVNQTSLTYELNNPVAVGTSSGNVDLVVPSSQRNARYYTVTADVETRTCEEEPTTTAPSSTALPTTPASPEPTAAPTTSPTAPETPAPDTPALQDKVWTSDVEKGTLEMRATQQEGQTSKVTLTRTVDEASVISGPFFARVSDQNGYDLGTEIIKPQVQVIGPDGKVLYNTTGDALYGSDIAPFDSVNRPTNGWGGLYIKGPDSLSVPAGSKVVVTMGFRPEPDHSPTVDGNVLSPTGPGELDLTFGARPGDASEGDSESSAPIEIQSCKAPVGRRAARELTDGEKADGTTVFVSHSPNATGIGSRTTTRLSRQIQGNENFSTLSESRWVYNALAYNRADNWLYAVSQRSDDPNNAAACPPGYLLQINPETGEVHNIGRVRRSDDRLNNRPSPFAKNNSVNDLDYLNTGWIGYNDGERLYVANSSTSGSRAVYTVTLPAAGDSNPQSSFLDNLANAASVYSEDHALLFEPSEPDPSQDPYAQYSWGLVSPAGVRALGYPAGTLLMERYDIANNRADRFVIDNPQTVGGKQVPTGKIWGKAWTYGNGNLGFGTGGQFYSNQSFQIKFDDPLSRSPKFTIVSVVENAPASFNTDGTSNAPMPVPPVDLAVEKVALDAGNDDQYGNALATLKKLNSRDSVTTRYWAVVVRNLSDGSSTGFTVTDQIPSVYDQNTIRGYSELSGQWDEFNVTRDYPEPGVASVEFNSGRLAGKSQRTFYFSAELKAGEECEVNTVAIRGNEVDQVPNNNEGSDLCSNDGVRVRLAKVDADNIDGVPADDAFLPDAQFRIDRLDRNSSVQLIRDADGFFALPEDLTPVGGLEGGLAPGEYQIVETKSPSGYSLLTAPIKFRVNAVESDERLTFDAANSAGYARVVSELSTDNDVVVAVGDVRQGNMPKTGGAGLQLPILFGGILIAAGALMGRRNVAA